MISLWDPENDLGNENAPCLDFWERSGFSRDGETAVTFSWDGGAAYLVPPQVAAEIPAVEAPVEPHG